MKLHAIVSGLVQGVFFRANTQKEARKLRLKGWVKNLISGDVEVLAVGPKENLEKLLEFLKIGPRWARVEYVKYEFLEEGNEDNFNDFEII